MHLSRIDLNLLVVFDTVYVEGSITAASRKLNLSQPAVSHALARLREVVGEPLFERRGRGIAPTPLARSIAGPVRDALAAVERTLQAGLAVRSRVGGAASSASGCARRWSRPCCRTRPRNLRRRTAPESRHCPSRSSAPRTRPRRGRVRRRAGRAAAARGPHAARTRPGRPAGRRGAEGSSAAAPCASGAAGPSTLISSSTTCRFRHAAADPPSRTSRCGRTAALAPHPPALPEPRGGLPRRGRHRPGGHDSRGLREAGARTRG